MKRRDIPYRKTVFVCTHVRAGGTACANAGRGGDLICALLKEEVKKAGLKGKVRVARSGCLDLCGKGPNVFLYPGGDWHAGVRPDDVPKLLEKIRSGL